MNEKNLEKRLFPLFEEKTAEDDSVAFGRRWKMFIDPFINEYLVFKGVLIQLFFALKDLFFLPFAYFSQSKENDNKSKYNCAAFIAFIIPLIIVQIIGWFYLPTFQLMIDLLAGQSIYPMRGVYTLSYILMKHTVKMKQYAHRAVRGAIRDNLPILSSIVLLTFYNFFSFVVQMIQICTLISGYEQFQALPPEKQSKKNPFLIALVNIQVINYKKFISKFVEGNQFILESYYRINMLFAVTYHWLFNSMQQVYNLLGTEFCFSSARYYLCSYTLDYGKYNQKMVKNANNAVLELNGQYKGHVHKSNYMNSFHESIAYILTLLLQFGPIPFRLTLFVLIVLFAVLSIFVPKLMAKTLPVSDSKKKD